MLTKSFQWKSVLTAAVCVLVLPVALPAQGNSGRIGFLSVIKAISESAEGKQALGEFQKKADAKRDELEKKNNEIQDLQRQMQSQARTLNDDSKAALAKNIDVKTTELQRAQDDAQKEFGQMQNEILGRIGNKVGPFVQQYAKEHNFAVIVDYSNQNSQVIYFDPGTDITDDIIKRVDASQAAPALAPALPAANKPK